MAAAYLSSIVVLTPVAVLDFECLQNRGWFLAYGVRGAHLARPEKVRTRCQVGAGQFSGHDVLKSALWRCIQVEAGLTAALADAAGSNSSCTVSGVWWAGNWLDRCLWAVGTEGTRSAVVGSGCTHGVHKRASRARIRLGDNRARRAEVACRARTAALGISLLLVGAVSTSGTLFRRWYLSASSHETKVAARTGSALRGRREASAVSHRPSGTGRPRHQR